MDPPWKRVSGEFFSQHSAVWGGAVGNEQAESGRHWGLSPVDSPPLALPSTRMRPRLPELKDQINKTEIALLPPMLLRTEQAHWTTLSPGLHLVGSRRRLGPDLKRDLLPKSRRYC